MFLPLDVEADYEARMVGGERLIGERLNFDLEVAEDLVQVPSSIMGGCTFGNRCC